MNLSDYRGNRDLTRPYGASPVTAIPTRKNSAARKQWCRSEVLSASHLYQAKPNWLGTTGPLIGILACHTDAVTKKKHSQKKLDQ